MDGIQCQQQKPSVLALINQKVTRYLRALILPKTWRHISHLLTYLLTYLLT